ncbi:MAG TPA: hypothetical protein VN193_13790 [Candidatus Angelobacter sp.]|nr:hypothetical protein [Candidatus Angelobacter sp.]
METQRDVAQPAGEPDHGDEVVWSREWEWPRLPSVRGRRPDPRTLGVVVFLLYAPFLVGGLWMLRPAFDAFRGVGVFSIGVPDWLRVYYGSLVGLSLAEAAVMVGALLLLRWRRAGGAVVLAGLFLDVVFNLLVGIAYLREGPVPTGTMARTIADVVTRLGLLAVAVFLLLPRAEPAAPADEPFRPPTA